MIHDARTMALLSAASISLVTILFLPLEENVSRSTLAMAGAISFLGSFILIYVVLEFLVFRKIKKILKMLSKLQKKEFNVLKQQRPESFNPLKNLQEEIYSFVSLKQKEIDELRKLETFRKEFIANVSHELKTPIFAAQGFIHTLLEGALYDKNVRDKFLKKAAKSMDGLDMLVEDLLTLTLIESGDSKMQFESFDLFKMCSEVLEQFDEKIQKKGIRLKLADPRQKLAVYADPHRISQVVTNLVSNAIKYSSEGGEVKVSFEKGKNYITTFVTDSGEGIPPEHLGRIFERFYLVDKSRSRGKGGTGLGLAIVKHILDGHDSRAEVESTVGKGSVFSFKLPRSKREGDEE